MGISMTRRVHKLISRNGKANLFFKLGNRGFENVRNALPMEWRYPGKILPGDHVTTPLVNRRLIDANLRPNFFSGLQESESDLIVGNRRRFENSSSEDKGCRGGVRCGPGQPAAHLITTH